MPDFLRRRIDISAPPNSQPLYFASSFSYHASHIHQILATLSVTSAVTNSFH